MQQLNQADVFRAGEWITPSATPEPQNNRRPARLRKRPEQVSRSRGSHAQLSVDATSTPSSPSAPHSEDLTAGRVKRDVLGGTLRRMFRRSARDDASIITQDARSLTPFDESAQNSPSVVRTELDAYEPHAAMSRGVPSMDMTSPPRTLPNTQKLRPSPYAVEFPHSAKLKPLNLGNPFVDGSRVLPSPRSPDRDAIRRSQSLGVEIREITKAELLRTQVPASPDISGIYSRFDPNRRSRSVEECVGSSDWFRPDNTDITNWTSQPLRSSPARVSGRLYRDLNDAYRTEGPSVDISRTPIIPPHSPLNRQVIVSEMQLQSPRPNIGSVAMTPQSPLADINDHQLSLELCHRVSKLEADMHEFQTCIERLAMARKRRQRSDQLSKFSQVSRPDGIECSRSPERGEQEQSRSEQNRSIANPTAHLGRPCPVSETNHGHQRGDVSSGKTNSESIPTTMGQTIKDDGRSFRVLYMMLTEERSARQKLESQVRDLRLEVAELQQHNNIARRSFGRRSRDSAGRRDSVRTALNHADCLDVFVDASSRPNSDLRPRADSHSPSSTTLYLSNVSGGNAHHEYGKSQPELALYD